MTIHNLDIDNSVLNHFISEIRDVKIQQDSMRFRRNIERIGEILSYELSKSLSYENKEVITPLGSKNISVLADNLVLCSVLRAGLPLHQGILNYFDHVENAFISAFRKHSSPEKFEIKVEYLASPSLDGKTLILADPMLATGSSLVAVFEALKSLGKLKQIHLVSVIAAKEGIEFVQNHFPQDTHLWVATVDEKLNSKGYIVPGLGDAGDLAFGNKL
ncbi:uracil phosphoribosyltransferase [Lutimonas saemankumensis]|uniref:uracil phosphoribosyltransferase n=1 Tax=Lutimonas saemankumensis TaxID=483016 RepID=UPI001CD3B15B|nr:uracil phosphoribosyltransferase [Lutimonas saemankumensis]MCA0932894.1 uracil phosphoribosyltransferase [Lutimonas saemankumensis]